MLVDVCEANDRSTSMLMSLVDISGMTSKLRIPCKLSALANSEAESSNSGPKNIEQVKAKFVNDKMRRCVYTPKCLPSFLNINTSSDMPHPLVIKRITACEHDPKPSLRTCVMENPVVQNEAPMGETNYRHRINFDGTYNSEKDIGTLPAKNVNQASAVTNIKRVENAKINDGNGGKPSKDPRHIEEEMDHPSLSCSTAPTNKNLGDVFKRMKVLNHNDAIPVLDREPTAIHEKRQTMLPAADSSISQKQRMKPSANMKMAHRDALTPRLPALCKSSRYGRAVDISEEKQQSKTNHKKQKLKQGDPTCIKEKGETSFLISSKVIFFTAMLVHHMPNQLANTCFFLVGFCFICILSWLLLIHFLFIY